MECRAFGRTGVQVSPWCPGTMNFGGPTDEQQAQQIAGLALDHGTADFGPHAFRL